jgi:exopolysaccharide production protein ExoZ
MDRKLDSLQSLRGMAAMLVVLFHASGMIGSEAYGDRTVFGDFFSWGHSGVQLFFVISGFIILYVYRNDIGRPETFKKYAIKRFVRIYPVYWVVLVPLIALYFAIPQFGTGAETELSVIVGSIFLVGTAPPILTVAWTLFHEILFYAIFGLMILNRGLGMIAMVIWFIGCVLGPTYVFAPINLLFLFGMVAALVALRPEKVPALTCLLFGASGFMAVGVAEWLGWFEPSDPPSTLLYGLTALLVVIGSVRLEQEGKMTIPRSTSFVGDASYSIYLVHYPVIVMGVKFWGGMPEHLLFTVVVMAAALAGIALHLLIERPLLAFTTRISVSLPLRISPLGARVFCDRTESSGISNRFRFSFDFHAGEGGQHG